MVNGQWSMAEGELLMDELLIADAPEHPLILSSCHLVILGCIWA